MTLTAGGTMPSQGILSPGPGTIRPPITDSQWHCQSSHQPQKRRFSALCTSCQNKLNLHSAAGWKLFTMTLSSTLDSALLSSQKQWIQPAAYSDLFPTFYLRECRSKKCNILTTFRSGSSIILLCWRCDAKTVIICKNNIRDQV